MRANLRTPKRKLLFSSKWLIRKMPLSKEKLKKVRRMFYRGIAYSATAEECGMTNSLYNLSK